MPVIPRRTLIKMLAAQALGRRVSAPQTKIHRAPRPLADDAVTHDWPSFLGPTHNGVSTETRLSRVLPPPIVWEREKGSGYASPAIASERLVFIHRLADQEVVECLHPDTGAVQWVFKYATAYRDRYGYNDGPRSSPVLEPRHNRVYTMGAEDKLHCLALDSGDLVWMRDLRQDYGVTQDFFGTASTPLVEGDLLVVNIGAPDGACVIAVEAATGQEVWRAGDWGPSYASPVPGVVHGERRVFVFAGGESNPPSGGLLSVDPASGDIDFAFPFRSRTFESVNASCPVVFDDNVFVSASYRTGGALLQIAPDFSHRVQWTTQDFALHYNTAIHHQGYLYGFDGRNQGDASLACVDVATGDIRWRETPRWTERFELDGQTRSQIFGTARGSLLAVDGQFLCLGELGHLIWMDLTPSGYREVSRAWLFAARESWALPVLSRGLLYVVQNAPDLIQGASPRLLCYDLRA